ncbi:hypothetical protein NPX13_g510 [Xylaria arbuscula]|uniref:Secreted protein n=1 Tax=Xylaria arbuscula TaxID=114810 RepID=A0A9W8NNU5_9PEZI|nr:hypothetical protein NPX13_g510 [Xylaria arbuscula]
MFSMARPILFLSALCFCVGVLATSPLLERGGGTSGSEFIYDRFVNPPASYRPKYRYWIPDASVLPENVADDIAQLGQRGAGGVEFNSYYSYGGTQGPAATDWDVYGFGTPAYIKILRTALQAHKDNGMVMDYTLGPQSGQGVPAELGNPGLAWDVVFHNVSIINGTYSGPLPGWGVGDLVSAVTFSVHNSTDHSDEFGQLFNMPLVYNYTRYLMSAESLTDVTHLVEEDGSITTTVDLIGDGQSQFLLYASYARQSYERACIASNASPRDLLQNGSFAVDHFSRAGADVIANFVEEHILVDGVKELLMEVGGAIFEDSVEIPADTYWTPDLLSTFEQQHGYSLAKHLPLLSGNEGSQTEGGGPIQIASDAQGQGPDVVADYRSTMGSLVVDYLQGMEDWVHKLGLQFRHQVGYNLPVDMLQLIPRVDIPETETLAFANDVDRFRQYCGAANLAGKPIISIELGADYWRAFSQSWTDLLQDAKRAYVAGVNHVVLHGAPYSHNFVNTTWPGYTTFQYLFGGHHSRQQPAWDLGYKQANDYLSRMQVVLRAGVARVDIAFWDKMTAQRAYPNTLYTPADLVMAGYTYNYLSPENFLLEEAYIMDGVLAPNRQGFKALVLRQNDTLTTRGVRDLETYVQAGLQLVILGDVPSTYTTKNRTQILEAQEVWKRITDLHNVHKVPDGSLGSILDMIGVRPRTQITSNGTWYTVWRDNVAETYVLIYNDGNYSTGSISFETTKTSYFLNCWTGERSPIPQYAVNESAGTTEIPFALQRTEAVLIMFSDLVSDQKPDHVLSLSRLLDLRYDASGSIWMKQDVSDEMLTTASFSNNSMPTETAALGTFDLTRWSVTVEQWLPPTDLFDIAARKVNVTMDVPGPALYSWADLNLTSASGIGYYTTDFAWESSSGGEGQKMGAVLDIPPVTHGIVGFINGKELPAMDITNPKVDITEYLTNGTNTILLQVSTTLVNSVAPVWNDIMTLGAKPLLPFDLLRTSGFGESANGIIGEVKIQPYRLTKISLA